MDNIVLFKEKQQFRQWWIWLIIIFVGGDALWSTVKIISSGSAKPFFEQNVLPFLLLLLPVALICFMKWAKLETEIKTDGIYVRFVPFHKRFRFYPWQEIERAYVRKYSPITEYGGWGLRGLGQNKALNISGNDGLQIVTLEGNRLLIGTQKPLEIEAVLNRIPDINKAPHQ